MKKDKRKRPDRRVRCRRGGWLIEDWRRAYRWLSVQAAAAIAALATVYDLFPTMREYIAPPVFRWMMVLGGIAVIVGRIKNQQPK